MSTTVPNGLNGRMKKTLAFQLDRLDSILDGLAEALNGAVADAVKATVGEAAREAVKVALEEAQSASAQPKSTNVFLRCWNHLKAMVSGLVGRIRDVVTAGCRKVKQLSTHYMSAAILAMQSGVSTLKSRSLRIGIMLGAITSCVVSLIRKDARLLWWGAGIIVCTMMLESYLGTIVTLILGGSVLYLAAKPQILLRLDRETLRQAA